jgi:lipopolysaccharide transport system permease protein
MMQEQEEEKWDLVIKPQSGWFDLHLDDLWRYRDLVMLFVRRDFVSVYKQTILGPIWFFIQPIFTTVTYMVIFSGIAKLSTSGAPPVLFYLSGITIWNYFSVCMNNTSNTFTRNASIFGKVYFPRLTVPVSIVISSLIQFAIQFGLFAIVLVYYVVTGVSFSWGWQIVLVPFLVILMSLLSLGLGIIFSSLTTKYRDLSFLLTFGIQLLMYATPVIYSISEIPPKLQFYIKLNPLSGIVETFRYALLGAGTFDVNALLYSIIFTFVALFFGVLIFNKVEKDFMDVV